MRITAVPGDEVIGHLHDVVDVLADAAAAIDGVGEVSLAAGELDRGGAEELNLAPSAFALGGGTEQVCACGGQAAAG